MAILSNAELALVPIEKLADYSLNPAHPLGKHKARVFSSALNLTTSDALFLRDAILGAVLTNPAQKTRADEFGQRYQVEFVLENRGKKAIVLTAWIIETGDF